MNRFCDKCGSVIDNETGVCPNCAEETTRCIEPIDADQLPSEFFNSKPEKPKIEKKKILGIVAVVVAFSILLGIFGILGKKKRGNPLPDSYDEIVEAYKLAISGEDDTKEKTLSSVLLSKVKEDENYEICYSLTDINGDEKDELIIGGRLADAENAETYDLYTMDDEEKAVQLFDVNNFSEEKEIKIYDVVIKVSEVKENYSHIEYLKLPENMCEVQKVEEYLYEDGKYFEVNDNEKKEITKEAFESADKKYENSEINLEWVKITIEKDHKEKDTTKPETTEPEITELTDAHLKSFEKMMNEMFFSLDGFEDYNNKIDTIINNFICSAFWAFPDGTMFDYYFPGDYKEVGTEPTFDESGVIVDYEFDAKKVLFILNDVFGLDVTNKYTRKDFYFQGDKFYYTAYSYGKGPELAEHKVVGYETMSDGYFKIRTQYVFIDYRDNNKTTTSNGWYFVTKPAKHNEYGDYWKIKEFGINTQCIWTNNENSKNGDDWKSKLKDTVYEVEKNKESSDVDCRYYLVDIDNNGIPEMLCDYQVSAYGKDFFYIVDENVNVKSFPGGVFYYIPNSKKILISSGRMGYYYDEIYKLDNGKLSEVSSGNSIEEPYEGYGSEFFWEDVKMSKNDYDKKMNYYFDTNKQISEYDMTSFDKKTILNVIDNY